MDRIIAHVDANSFYASVELLSRPELRDKPVAVCGDPQARHGIILAKNEPAKAFGVRTAEAIWMARQKCPDLILLPSHFPLYHDYSQRLRQIYDTYSDRVEAFGLDECWIDLTHDTLSFDDGVRLCDSLRERVYRETGLTVSIGVSFNKVFSKLGSDMKKPNALTALPLSDMRRKIWPLPVGTLLFAGPRTVERMHNLNIRTIGDLALAQENLIRQHFGKSGLMLQRYALGKDDAPVTREDMSSPVKSIGNSTTTSRDLETLDDVRYILTVLSEQVSTRLREHGLKASCLSLSVRTPQLISHSAQMRLPCATTVCGDLYNTAMQLFMRRFATQLPLRSIGINCSALVPRDEPVQMDLLGDTRAQLTRESFEDIMDDLRHRYGPSALTHARTLLGKDSFLPTDVEEATLSQRGRYFTGKD